MAQWAQTFAALACTQVISETLFVSYNDDSDRVVELVVARVSSK